MANDCSVKGDLVGVWSRSKDRYRNGDAKFDHFNEYKGVASSSSTYGDAETGVTNVKEFSKDTRKRHKLKRYFSTAVNRNVLAHLVSKIIRQLTQYSEKEFKSKSYVVADVSKSAPTTPRLCHPDDTIATNGLSSRSSYADDLSQKSCLSERLIPTIDGKILGISGLKNHGNTCFMNATLQCLFTTDLLAEYFVTDLYKADIAKSKNCFSKFSSKGEITEQLAFLLKGVWMGHYNSELTANFKDVVSKYGTQYVGNAQHDAQEFLLWLLDKVHEDLSFVTKKKSWSFKGLKTEDDSGLTHLKDDSFVHSLFQAKYRSTLTCESCRKSSCTFDPFLCISLPIPQSNLRTIHLTVSEGQQKQLLIAVEVEERSNIAALRTAITKELAWDHSDLMLLEQQEDAGFVRSFEDRLSVSAILESTQLLALSIPCTLPSANSRTSYRGKIVLFCVCSSGANRFAWPYSIVVEKSAAFQELVDCLIAPLVPIMATNWYYPEHFNLIKLRVINGLGLGKSYLDSQLKQPLNSATVVKGTIESVHGYLYAMLVFEWTEEGRSLLFDSRADWSQPVDGPSLARLREKQYGVENADLEDCLEMYTTDERLLGDNAWRCSGCKQAQTGTMKQLFLWSLPDVLLIHLKRFKQLSHTRCKLHTLVNFPLSNLSLNKYTAAKSEGVYDLYAVCNHHGVMGGGHYTAYCKHPITGSWNVFDDEKVQPLADDQVVTNDAYILFYHRRASRTSTTELSNDHWSSTLPGVTMTPASSTRSLESSSSASQLVPLCLAESVNSLDELRQ